MNRDDIIRMAREAMGHTSIQPNDKVTFYVSYNNGIDADGFCDSVETFIEHFANLVAAAERDAICALLDSLVDTYENRDRQGSAEDIRKLIQYIHARGQ